MDRAQKLSNQIQKIQDDMNNNDEHNRILLKQILICFCHAFMMK